MRVQMENCLLLHQIVFVQVIRTFVDNNRESRIDRYLERKREIVVVVILNLHTEEKNIELLLLLLFTLYIYS